MKICSEYLQKTTEEYLSQYQVSDTLKATLSSILFEFFSECELVEENARNITANRILTPPIVAATIYEAACKITQQPNIQLAEIAELNEAKCPFKSIEYLFLGLRNNLNELES